MVTMTAMRLPIVGEISRERRGRRGKNEVGTASTSYGKVIALRHLCVERSRSQSFGISEGRIWGERKSARRSNKGFKTEPRSDGVASRETTGSSRGFEVAQVEGRSKVSVSSEASDSKGSCEPNKTNRSFSAVTKLRKKGS